MYPRACVATNGLVFKARLSYRIVANSKWWKLARAASTIRMTAASFYVLKWKLNVVFKAAW